MTTAETITGDDLMREVFTLMRDRLPLIREDDPMQHRIIDLVHGMGAALVRAAEEASR